MRRMGVFATDEEIEAMKGAIAQPVMFLSGGVPMGGESAQAMAQRLALEHGLADYQGMYGCDLTTGEFVGADNAPDFIPPAPKAERFPAVPDDRSRARRHGDPLAGALHHA